MRAGATTMRRALLAITAVTLAALAVAHIAIALTRPHETTSDWASIEMRTRDVFSRHPPLIGAWSRFEWSHPGPLLFYVLAVPYRIGGQTWQSLWISAALVNVVAIGLAVWLTARRHAGLAALFLLAALATVAGFRSHLLTDDWNATIVVLPVLLVLAAAAAVLAGDRAGLPILVLAYVFVAQCHLGYGVVLLPAAAWAAVHAARTWRRPTLHWLGVGAALWLPVAIDTLANWPGNLLTSLGWNVTADERATGFAEAARVIGRSTSLTFVTDPGIPTFDVEIDRPPLGTLPFVALIALALVWWLCRRARLDGLRRPIELVAATWAVGFVAVARIKGPLFRWIVDWTYPLAALTWLLVLGALVAAVVSRPRPTTPAPTRPVIAVIGLAAATLATVNIAGSVGEPYINAPWVPIVRQFRTAAETDPRIGRAPILVDIAGDLRLTGAIQAGLVNLLEQDGFDPRVRPDQGLQFGGQRIRPARPEHVLIRSETKVDPLPGASAITVYDPLTPAERTEADALTVELAALLVANDLAANVPILDTPVADLAAYRAPPAVTAELARFRRLAELRQRGPRVVLYFVPA